MNIGPVMFLQTHLIRPRNLKQMRNIAKEGQLFVAFVERSQSVSSDIPEGLFQKVYKLTMDVPESKRFFKRVIASFSMQSFFNDAMCEVNPKCIQVEGLDCLYFAFRYIKKNPSTLLVYQVSDVRESLLPQKGLLNTIRGRFIANFEAYLLKRASILVVTSEQFFERRYRRYFSDDRLVVWHNYPDPVLFEAVSHVPSDEFRVVFVGSIRYQRQLRNLVDAVSGINDCKAIFSGAGKKREYDALVSYCEGKPWTSITGPYDYDTEIVSIYSNADCIFAVYDATNENVKIALPNKLYEAVFCGLPILVAQGTYLEQLVLDWGVGLSVPCDDSTALCDVIKELKENRELRETISKNCAVAKQKILSETPKNDYIRAVERLTNEC